MTPVEASSPGPARLLITRFRSGAELLERYLPAFEAGGLFVPTRKVLHPGEPVVLDIRLPALRDHTWVRGKVAYSRRGRRKTGIRAGLAIELLPEEREKRDYLLALARDSASPAAPQRKFRRIPVTDYRVHWRIPSQQGRHASTIGDIGQGGAFIRTRTPLPAGTSVVLELVPPGGLAPQLIEGRVAWVRQAPGTEGLGVEFRCRDLGGLRRLRELVRRIRDDQVTAFHAA